MNIYTRSGDGGETGLLFGGRVPKTDIRTETYGATDHAVSAMGLARAMSSESRVGDILLDVQRDMFMVGAELATDLSNRDILAQRFRTTTADHVSRLESLIDDLAEEVQLPPNFIIPGASPGSAALDIARTQVREAERRIVAMHREGLLPNTHIMAYVNRLSDLLFMLARYEDRHLPFEIVTGQRPNRRTDDVNPHGPDCRLRRRQLAERSEGARNFRRARGDHVVPGRIPSADGLVVPGQGACDSSMRHLRERGLIDPLRDYISSGRPFLGVCLGLQLLLDASDEGDEPCWA